MKFSKSRLLLVSLLVVGALLILFAKVFVPWGTARQIRASVENNCRTCQLEIGRTTFSVFFPTKLSLHRVHLTGGEKGATEVDAVAERIEAEVSVIPLILGRIHFDAIRVVRPNVIVTDGDGHSPPSPPKAIDDEKPLFDFLIQETLIDEGNFAYVRNYRGTHAVLRIGRINGGIGALGTVRELREASAKAQVFARVENSGEVEVLISTFLFSAPLRVAVEVRVKDQNLGDLSNFFGENDGVFLKGRLIKGRAQVAVRERRLTSEVWAKYEDLDVKLRKTQDRSAFAAFIANLGEALTVNSRNVGKREEDQIREVTLDREEKESLVSFILRGMKEAALKVASSRSSNFD